MNKSQYNLITSMAPFIKDQGMKGGLFKRYLNLKLIQMSYAFFHYSFSTSRLDYCSCLYTGLPATRLSCLDRVLRSAARLIGRIPKYDHISIYMRDILHWLPAR